MALACLLAALALLHAFWGLGGVWPGHDEKSCAKTIAGFRGVERMPSPAASFAVAFALLVAAFVAMALGGIVAPIVPSSALLALAGAGAAALFLGRGIAGYTAAWRRLAPEMPFALYDRLYYSPLCLMLGAGFATLLFREGNP